MTDRRTDDIVVGMSINPREQIQIDCPRELRYLIRAAALAKGWSLREAVLYGLGKQFPELNDRILAELEGEDA